MIRLTSSVFALTLGALYVGCSDDPVAARVDAGADAGMIRKECAADQLSECTAGRCTLSAPKAALKEGDKVTLTEMPLPAELAGDALVDSVCKVEFTATTANAFTLGIKLNEAATGAGTLFLHAPPGPASIVSSTVKDGRIEGLVTGPGVYGATSKPAPVAIEATIDNDPNTTLDTPSLIRNVTAGAVTASYYDGTRLFVASGSRVLIYRTLPASPSVAPDVVLGQPDLNTPATGVSSAIFGTVVTSIWSNGTKLAIATGNRVLLWNTIPAANFAPADLVLGQPDFSTNISNLGGISASTLSRAWGVSGDANRLVVSDLANNRFLVWNQFPTRLGQPASLVVGQPSVTDSLVFGPPAGVFQAWSAAFDGAGMFAASYYGGVFRVPALASGELPSYFVSARTPAVSDASVYFPASVARVSGGGLAVGDDSAKRIVMYRAVPAGERRADFVLGQPDATRQIVSPVSASTTQSGVRVSGGELVTVPDSSRVLIWEKKPSYNFEPASRVIGQPGFTTNDVGIDYRRISEKTLGYPADVAADANRVVVADRGNNRVLIYSTSSISSPNAAAAVVLGQPNAQSFVPNLDQVSPSAARMNGPSGVAFAGGKLVVADTENHRVLVWNALPTSSGASADLVLGQADFTGHRPNRGRGDADLDGFCDTGADGMFAPTGVATDGTRIFVADRLNHRVLVWDSFPTASGQAASRVIGQANFTDVGANRGRGGFEADANGFNLPSGLLLRGTALWVADTENNRVVRIDNVDTTPAPGLFMGQTDGVTLQGLNYAPLGDSSQGLAVSPPSSATTLARPRGIAFAQGRIYISETDSNRVHIFDGTSFASVGVLGQANDAATASNAPSLTAKSLAAPRGLASDGTHLLVADSANHRILGFDLGAAAPAPASAATLVVGQLGFTVNAFNQALATSVGGGVRPRALAQSGNELFVTETDRNRIVVREFPLVAGAPLKRIYGQPNDGSVLPNAGGAASASSLNGPRGVYVDSAKVAIADTANHRVLIFDKASQAAAATVVLGQADFTSALANRGGQAGPGTLFAPEAVAIDGGKLFVADTGNHRVLVWNAIPSAAGAPADLVIGQANASDVLANRGETVASAGTLFSPIGLAVTNGVLFIADSGNNRVLRFATVPSTSGALASSVLGQASLATRQPAATASDLSKLSGPVSLASDGTNLYVADRDLARVVLFTLASQEPAVPAVSFLGSADGITLRSPSGIAATKTPLFTSRVFISDTAGDRVVILKSVSRLAGSN
jgi:NHL repeat